MSYSAPPPPPPPPGDGPGGYGAPPPGGGYGAPPPPGGYAPSGTNTKSVWALVLGIVGLLCCAFFTGVPAIILGRSAQREIDTSGGIQGGRGMATAGFVLGIIASVWGVVWIILVASGVVNFNSSFRTSP